MTIQQAAERGGVDVHLDPEECELFVKLASDADKAAGGPASAAGASDGAGATYFTLSVALGRRIRALTESPRGSAGHEAIDAEGLGRTMVNLILAADAP